MAKIRWRNRAVTAITPHAGNRRVLIPPYKGTSTPPAVPDWTTDPPAVPDGDENVPYSYNLANDLNTTIGVAITVTAGSLPDGLSISGTNIVGTPTTPGTFSGIQLTATNVSGSDESLPFSMDIAGAPATTALRFDNPVQSGKEVLDQGTEVFSGGLTAPGVSGDIANGEVITISTLAAEDFGAKPFGAQPLFWWTADGGDDPSPLGRTASWNSGFDGDDERQQVIVAPGSTWSYRFDHGQGGAAALGSVKFAPSNQFYSWRKKYDDFFVNDDYGIRTRIINLTGSLPAEGLTVTGQTSGATGVVHRTVDGGISPRDEIYYYNDQGSISGPTPTDFINGETMTWATGSGVNDESASTFRSFNYKIIRVWPDPQELADMIISCQYLDPDYRWFIEGISGTGQDTGLDQGPDAWEIQEFKFTESSGLGVADGEWSIAINGSWYTRDAEITRNATYPTSKEDIFSSQVSNGAQPQSYIYNDSWYIDDSYCRVLIDGEIQIPTAWAAGAVSVQVRGGPQAGQSIRVYDSNDNLATTRLIS